MVRLAWLARKEIDEADDIVELEEFLRSVLPTDGEPVPRPVAGEPVTRALEEDGDETDVLDDEAVPTVDVPLPVSELLELDEPLDEGLLEVPLPDPPQPAPDEPLAVRHVPPLEPQLVDPHERSNEPQPDPAMFEPRPQQLDELLDEALSETFPASDPIAVSPKQ
jgi:hypothetical protein